MLRIGALSGVLFAAILLCLPLQLEIMTAAAGSADIPVSHHRYVQNLVRKAKNATIE